MLASRVSTGVRALLQTVTFRSSRQSDADPRCGRPTELTSPSLPRRHADHVRSSLSLVSVSYLFFALADTIFTCIFCHNPKSITVKIDKKDMIGHLQCSVCGQRFSVAVNGQSISPSRFATYGG